MQLLGCHYSKDLQTKDTLGTGHLCEEGEGVRRCLLFLQRPISLLWSVRLKIANQIADALHFLHTVNQPKCLVHGDVMGYANPLWNMVEIWLGPTPPTLH